MTEQELIDQNAKDFSQLKKLIRNWECISDCDNNFLHTITSKILTHLYKNADAEKISNVISGELMVNYGLFSSDFDSQKLAVKVFEW